MCEPHPSKYKEFDSTLVSIITPFLTQVSFLNVNEFQRRQQTRITKYISILKEIQFQEWQRSFFNSKVTIFKIFTLLLLAYQFVGRFLDQNTYVFNNQPLNIFQYKMYLIKILRQASLTIV